jgi:hypothetical protein
MTKENYPSRRKQFDLPKSILTDAVHFRIPIEDVTNKRKLLRELVPKNEGLKQRLLEGLQMDEIDPDGMFQVGGGETRMNKATF